MLKKYIKPCVQITELNFSDIITASALNLQEIGYGDRIDFNDFIK